MRDCVAPPSVLLSNTRETGATRLDPRCGLGLNEAMVRRGWIVGLLLMLSCGTPPPDVTPGTDTAASGDDSTTSASLDTGSGTQASGSSTGPSLPPPELGVHQIQVEGSHNSYHVPNEGAPPIWQYELPPLRDQLDLHGVRQFELDVHYEPEGWFSVYHVPGLDEGTSCAVFVECLEQIEQWSAQNPEHHLLFILIEPKDDLDVEKIVGHYGELEQEIVSVWSRERVLAPADVQGSHATLRDAVLAGDWPTVDQTRGMAMFVLFDGGMHRDEYVGDGSDVSSVLMFPSSDEQRPDGAFIKLDDPVADAERIRAAVEDGFIVRTRADAELLDPGADDYARLEAALESGAQLVSTDYPDEEGDYWLQIPEGTPSRCNPLTAPPGCAAEQIESL